MPFSPNSTDVLSWESMTAAVNEIKSPSSFVKNLLFSASDPKPTRTIELSYLKRGRQIAPFVKRGASALLVNGHNEQFVVVEPPHIRIKRNMEPNSLLNTRRPGTRIFVNEAEMRQAIDAYMAQELQNLSNDADESLEWLASQVLTGTVSYENDDEAAFEIVIPRSASHSYDLVATYHWDETNDQIAKDMMTVMELINDDVSLSPTDCILGTEAADAFMANAAVQALLKQNQQPGILTGGIDFTQVVQSSGALFLGSPFHNIRVWRYGRTTSVNGVTTNLIRPKYAEFVTALPAAQNVTYYGAIEDLDAFGDGGLLARPRFSKSWDQKDPSVRIALLETNPLPCLRRPDSTASIKVVSG